MRPPKERESIPTSMCEGSRSVWRSGVRDDPHPAGRYYPPCWRCGRSNGCSKCAGPPSEVLCTVCAAWGQPEGLAYHGPILNTPIMVAKRHGTYAPQVDDYPSDFVASYLREPKPELSAPPLPDAVRKGLGA